MFHVFTTALTALLVLLPYKASIEQGEIHQVRAPAEAKEAEVVSDIVLPVEAPEIAPQELTAEDRIRKYSEEFGIPPGLPLAVCDAESNLRNVCNEEFGCLAGIGTCQIVQSTFDEQCPERESPYNEDDNTYCTVKMMAAGQLWRWEQSQHKWNYKIPSECSCIKTLRDAGIAIPFETNAEDLHPNTFPHVGAVVLLKYKRLYHAALIIKIDGEGFTVYEGNYEPCHTGERYILLNDPAIRGFWELK